DPASRSLTSARLRSHQGEVVDRRVVTQFLRVKASRRWPGGIVQCPGQPQWKRHKVGAVATLLGGVFQIRESVQSVATKPGVSKFTTHNYLNEIESK
ncbi:MAG: helix-turn-helix domain-containing protein, partial [Actinomycetota bacterium]|nr:helix-turn-helix domain-containing protein [Actinomycetota bacterium]